MTGSGPHRVPVVVGIVDLWRAEVERSDGGTVPLTQLEVSLLRHLAAHPATPVSREVLLREVWGVDGALRTRAVDAAVKRLRKKIERVPSEPDHLRKVHGVGYVFFPLRPMAGTSPPGPERAALGSAVVAALDRGGRVTLVGAPGVGKSWLARRVAERSGARVVWVDAAGAAGRADLAQALHSAVRAGLPAASIREVLRELAPVTLVVDGADGVEAEALPGDLDGVSVLVTRRMPLGTVGEEVIVVPPLSRSEAIALFESLSAAAGRPVAPADGAAVAALVDRLDRLPLAIELAVGRTGVLSIQELIALYDAQGNAVVAPPLLEGIARAWRAIGPEDRDVLARLAVFRGPFSLHAARTILARPVEEVVEILRELTARSLVRVERSPEGTRYTLLGAVREIAREATPDGAVRRWCRWGLEAVTAGEPERVSRADLAALWSSTSGQARLRLACALDDRDRGTRPLADLIRRLQDALDAAPAAPAVLRADALLRLGRALGLAGRHAEAADALAAVAPLAGERPILGERAAIGLASARRILDDLDGASQALAPVVESRDRQVRGMARWGLGVIARARGHLAACRDHLLDAIETGDPRSRGMALESLAVLHREVGEVDRARTLFRRAADTLAPLDPVARAHVCCNLGMLELDVGGLEAARGWFDEALRASRRFGDPEVGRLARAGRALSAVLRGADDAPVRVQAALAGEASGLAETMRHLAAAGLAGPEDPAAAIAHLVRAEAAAVVQTRGAIAWLRALATERLAPERAARIRAGLAPSPLIARLVSGAAPAGGPVLVGQCLVGLVPRVSG